MENKNIKTKATVEKIFNTSAVLVIKGGDGIIPPQKIILPTNNLPIDIKVGTELNLEISKFIGKNDQEQQAKLFIEELINGSQRQKVQS